LWCCRFLLGTGRPSRCRLRKVWDVLHCNTSRVCHTLCVLSHAASNVLSPHRRGGASSRLARALPIDQ
jgi:hypothetical protein